MIIRFYVTAQTWSDCQIGISLFQKTFQYDILHYCLTRSICESNVLQLGSQIRSELRSSPVVCCPITSMLNHTAPVKSINIKLYEIHSYFMDKWIRWPAADNWQHKCSRLVFFGGSPFHKHSKSTFILHSICIRAIGWHRNQKMTQTWWHISFI